MLPWPTALRRDLFLFSSVTGPALRRALWRLAWHGEAVATLRSIAHCSEDEVIAWLDTKVLIEF